MSGEATKVNGLGAADSDGATSPVQSAQPPTPQSPSTEQPAPTQREVPTEAELQALLSTAVFDKPAGDGAFYLKGELLPKIMSALDSYIQEQRQEAIHEAEMAARDLERAVDYRYLPVGTKLKSKRTGNTVEIIDAAYHYELKHHNDVMPTDDDYSNRGWEEVKGWFDVTFVPANPSSSKEKT
jgi:hypothetical protein